MKTEIGQVQHARALAACLIIGGVMAAGPALAQAPAALPASGLYIGAGGSLNVSRFGTQNTYFAGVADAYQGGVRTDTGGAGGPARIGMGSDAGAAPSGQIGYYQNFSGSRWLWGAKASYSYLGASTTTTDALLPQFGSFTNIQTGVNVPFTGNGVVRAYQMQAGHQIALTPFLGRSYEHGFLYIGGGPTLTRLQTSLNGLIGFADLSGVRTNISGPPQNFSSSGWVWGGMFIVGATYFVSPSWFLDLTYTASATQRQSANYSSSFVNTSNSIATGQGGLILSSSGGVVTQGATLTLNRRF